MTQTTVRGKVSITVGDHDHRRVIDIENTVTPEGIDRLLTITPLAMATPFNRICLSKGIKDADPNVYSLQDLPFEHEITDYITPGFFSSENENSVTIRFTANLLATRDLEFDTVHLCSLLDDEFTLCTRANTGSDETRPTYSIQTGERVRVVYYLLISILNNDDPLLKVTEESLYHHANKVSLDYVFKSSRYTGSEANVARSSWEIHYDKYVKGSGKLRYKVLVPGPDANRYTVPFSYFSLVRTLPHQHHDKTFELSLVNVTNDVLIENGVEIVAPSTITTITVKENYYANNAPSSFLKAEVVSQVTPFTDVELYYGDALAAVGKSDSSGEVTFHLLIKYNDPYTGEERNITDGVLFRAKLTNSAGSIELPYIPVDRTVNPLEGRYWSAPGKITLTGRLGDIFNIYLPNHTTTEGVQVEANLTDPVATFTLTQADTAFGIDGAKQEFDLDLSQYKLASNTNLSITRTDLSGNVSYPGDLHVSKYPGLPDIQQFPTSERYRTLQNRLNEKKSAIYVYPVLIEGTLT